MTVSRRKAISRGWRIGLAVVELEAFLNASLPDENPPAVALSVPVHRGATCGILRNGMTRMTRM
ncbi:MAG TPA: hypothetical protein VE079_17065 [Ensifer sp.]|nr:hypothetical protein [Ensifer sp.]